MNTCELGTTTVHRGLRVTLVSKQLPWWVPYALTDISQRDVEEFVEGIPPVTELWVEDGSFVDTENRCQCPRGFLAKTSVKASEVYWWERVGMRSGYACSACRRVTQENYT